MDDMKVGAERLREVSPIDQRFVGGLAEIDRDEHLMDDDHGEPLLTRKSMWRAS